MKKTDYRPPKDFNLEVRMPWIGLWRMALGGKLRIDVRVQPQYRSDDYKVSTTLSADPFWDRLQARFTRLPNQK